MRNVVVVDGFRTPLCKEGTDFRETGADVLGAWVVREMITRCHRWNLPLETIDCVLGSNVATPMYAVNPTRVAAVTGGLPVTIPADTVAGKNCGSGVTALYYASLRIRSGDADTVLVIGMEAMSRIPIVYNQTVANLLLQYGKAKSPRERTAVALALIPTLLHLKKISTASRVDDGSHGSDVRPHHGTDGREYRERSCTRHLAARSGHVFHSIAQARGASMEGWTLCGRGRAHVRPREKRLRRARQWHS